MPFCPKCHNIEFFTGYFCQKHQNEYDEWLNADYKSHPCHCGNNEWKEGVLKMNEAGSFQEVYRCTKCNEVQIEKSEKYIRIRFRNVI